MPRSRPTETEEERERRRELQRGYEKASYHRKRQAIAALKAEVESLQREFQELSVRNRVEVLEEAGNQDDHLLSDANTDTESDDHGADPDTAKKRMNAAVRRLYRTKIAVEELCTENAQLQCDVDERVQLEARLRNLLTEHQTMLQTEQPFAFVSLPFDVYSEIIAKVQDHALRFFYDDAKLSTGSSIFGWRDYRKPLEDGSGMFDYAFEQEFSSVSAVDLAAKTWNLLASANGFASLYDRRLNARIFLLQQIDKNTCLYHSKIEPFPGVISKTLYLVSRTAIANGYLIVMCGLDPSLISFCDNDDIESKRSAWQTICSWDVVQDVGDGRTLFHFGGRNRILIMLEVLLVLLRWQSKVIGPLMVLPPSDS